MLLEVIFLVLSAVVLTVLGVGMVKQTPVQRYIQQETTEAELPSHIAGRTTPGVGIQINSDVLGIYKSVVGNTLPNEKTVDDTYLEILGKTVTGLHEGYHAITDQHPIHGHKFRGIVGKENYADLAGLYYAIDRRNKEVKEGNMDDAVFWQDVAFTAAAFYKNSGRAEKFGTKRKIADAGKYLIQTEIDSKGDMDEAYRKVQEVPLPYSLRDGVRRTGNVFDDKKISRALEREGNAELGSADNESHDMSLKPIIYNEKGKNRIFEVLKYLRDIGVDIYAGHKTLSKSFEENKYSPEKGYPDISKILHDFKNPINNVLDPIYYKPLGLKKSESSGSAH